MNYPPVGLTTRTADPKATRTVVRFGRRLCRRNLSRGLPKAGLRPPLVF